MGKTYGYMRVSRVSQDQKFARQEEQLKDQVDVMFQERISGGKRNRPELNKMLELVEEGDTVKILSIDRLSRSTRDLLDIVETLREKGVNLVSIHDSWLDISDDNPMSDFMLTMMGALAEMERKQIVARVNEGLAVAKKNGVELGRPKTNKTKTQYAIELYDKGEHTVKEIATITGISKATLYRKLKKREREGEQYA